MPSLNEGSFELLALRVISCELCPRLVQWRRQVARQKVRRFAQEEYWGRPVPGFGDPRARLLVVGLAPAAHGANRTGRMFTGDRSGQWLYRALYRAGFANKPVSLGRDDGLKLTDCYIAAAVRCAPPQNKPLPGEIKSCQQFLMAELELLRRLRVIVALGRIAFDAAIAAICELTQEKITPKPKFAHGAQYRLGDDLILLASFHPSQQNTFTGRLTEAMLDEVFERARSLITADNLLPGDTKEGGSNFCT
jgi:uracil-DNA glycosylase family 4